MIKIPILTYHANNINGRIYQNNDLVALAADLKVIHELGLNVIKMDQLIAWHQGQLADDHVKNAVVLSCDDGTWFDYYDVEHPFHGHQTSLFNTLKNHQQTTGQRVHMTNFVIVSAEARTVLDKTCLIGQGWWTDEWWTLAQQSGLMAIANHSWDHNHGVLDNENHNDDSFRCINTQAACDRQIKQAQNHLHRFMGPGYQCPYFAYPYGNFSEYLRHEYLPKFGHQLGLVAAFTTEAAHVTKQSQLWAMPRFVCNNDWHSAESLTKILTESQS